MCDSFAKKNDSYLQTRVFVPVPFVRVLVLGLILVGIKPQVWERAKSQLDFDQLLQVLHKAGSSRLLLISEHGPKPPQNEGWMPLLEQESSFLKFLIISENKK